MVKNRIREQRWREWEKNDDVREKEYTPKFRSNARPVETNEFSKREGNPVATTKWLHSMGEKTRNVTTTTRWPRSQLAINHVEEALRAGIIEITTTPRWVTRVFTVVEESKLRERIICDSLEANLRVQSEPQVRFNSVEEVLRQTRTADYAATMDFTSYYFQFEMDEKIRDYFSFTMDGETFYRFTRLPMGYKMAVEVAQETSMFLVGRQKSTIFVDVYIDNILLLGQREEVREAMEILKRKCETWKVTIGEWEEGRVVTHRGMKIDLNDKTASLSEKMKGKIRIDGTKGSKLQWRNWEARIARLIYATRALGVHRCRYQEIFHWYANNMGTNPFKWVTCEFVDTIGKLEKELLQGTRSLQQKRNHVTVITDAARSTEYTGTGWFRRIGEMSVEGKATEKKNCTEIIVILELRAVLEAIPNEHSMIIDVWIDNTAAGAALKRMWSPQGQVCLVLQEIAEVLKQREGEFGKIRYIPTMDNPADPLSRGVSEFTRRHEVAFRRIFFGDFSPTLGGMGWRKGRPYGQ